ncbi:MAG: ABC transporter substrate-binding protein [Spirochaetaceae bacterium]|jgi:taurine transport system substrate-binding protein|nr:ABC transporter substrate-binding protein [Spirochaetaceae bacterium]
MKKTKFLQALLAAAIFAALAVAGCSKSRKETSAGKIPAEIRLGYFQSPNAELLAKGLGLLEKRLPGVKISWILFEVGRDVNTAMASNSLDIATIGTPPGTSGIANGLPYLIYYLHDTIGSSEALIVKGNSGIKTIQDIKNKIIATPFSSTSHFSLLAALKQNNIGENELTILDMNGQDIAAAWQRGDINGTYIWQPVQGRLIEDGGSIVITSADVAAGGDLTGEFGIVSSAFVKEYPEIVQTYIDVLNEATALYRSGSAEVIGVLSGELGISLSDTKTAMSQIVILDKEEQKNSAYLGTHDHPGKLPGLLKKTAGFLFEQGAITSLPGEETFINAIAWQFYE